MTSLNNGQLKKRIDEERLKRLNVIRKAVKKGNCENPDYTSGLWDLKLISDKILDEAKNDFPIKLKTVGKDHPLYTPINIIQLPQNVKELKALIIQTSNWFIKNFGEP